MVHAEGSPPEYYDVALRDFGLMVGALTLNRLATARRRTTGMTEHRPAIAHHQMRRAG